MQPTIELQRVFTELKSKTRTNLEKQKTIEDLKILTENISQIDSKELLSLIESFSNTWFSLDKYDKNVFPTIGTKQELLINATDLLNDLFVLKNELIQKNEATELFAQEKLQGSLQGILGNVYQTIFGRITNIW